MANGSQSMPKRKGTALAAVRERRRREREREGLNSPTNQIDYPESEKKALRDYTESSHINFELGTKGYDKLTDKEKTMVDDMDAAINKSGWNETETNTKFLRGGGAIMVGVPKDKYFSTPEELANYINDNIVGKGEAINDGYTSITSSKNISGNFAHSQKNPIIMHYDRIEEGVRGAYVSGGPPAISYFGTGEDETILERGIATSANRAWVDETGHVHVSVNIRSTR